MMDILCRFSMGGCKSINTPMDSNLRRIHETDIRSDPVDLTLYKQMSELFMYLIHSRIEIFYVVSILIRFMNDPRER